MACAALKRPHNFDLLSNSPEQISGSPKRRRCGAVVTSCSSTNISPFLEATPKLCRDEFSKNVQDEWRRIQRRRRLLSPNSPPNNTSNLQTQTSMFSSSTSTSFGSPSSYSNLIGSSPPHGSMSPGSMSPSHSPLRERDQQPLTVKQVVSLCERLWKEREEKLREEYDKVLNDRLAEQYDSFLKFTQDQIMRKFQHSSCSYVS